MLIDQASDCLSVVNISLRTLLRRFSDQVSQGQEFDSDRTTGTPFGTLQHHSGIIDGGELLTPEAYLVSICVAYITGSSTMSRDSGNPTNDPDLEHFILESEGHAFLAICQAYCSSVRAGTLHTGPAVTRDFLAAISQKLRTWDLWRSEAMHMLIFQLLDIFSPIWLQEAGEVKAIVQKLFPRWAIKKVVGGGSWKSRAAFSFFLGKHLLLESFQWWWTGLDPGDSMDLDDARTQDEDNPLDMLGDLMSDGDVRVRYLSSTLYPAIFSHPGVLGQDIMALYTVNMSKKLPSNPQWSVSNKLSRPLLTLQ